jgi:hypothetical protein
VDFASVSAAGMLTDVLFLLYKHNRAGVTGMA